MTKQPTAQIASSLMMKLKEATQEHHRRAEERKLQRELLAGELPREVFATYLGELLCVHRDLERRLLEQAGADARIASIFEPHCIRENDLVADLEFYGYLPGPATAATKQLLDDFDAWAGECRAALLGPLYVLEGSMNGNRFIAQVLERKWSLSPGPGLCYLNPYGEEQGERWAAFRAAVDAQEFTPREERAILTAAQRTFDAISAIADTVYAR